jgi:surfactin synthase thioesterase subunit
MSNCIYEVLSDLKNIIYDNLNYEDNYILLGHSMGGLLAFLLCSIIERENLIKQPEYTIILGKNPPIKDYGENKKLLYSNEALKEYLISMGGTSEEILENEDFFDFFSSIIKADLKLINSLNNDLGIEIINTPIFFIGGKNDEKVSEYKGWEKLTTSKVYFYFFEGGHFFINSKFEEIISLLKSEVINI